MGTELRRTRELRQQLETYRPKTGRAKWDQIFREFRVAGTPRSIAVTKRVIIFEDILKDEAVGELDKQGIREALKEMRRYASYKERAWLNQEKLKQFEAQYRSNDYRDT